MLEGWEWIIIIGGVALTFTAVMVVALLYFLAKPKIITFQGYAPQQYSQQPLAQNNSTANRFCSQCGFSMASGTKFCSNCGKQLN